MLGSLADLLGGLGIGGAVGAVLTAMLAGKALAERLKHIADQIESALRDPRSADMNTVLAELRLAETQARALLKMLGKVAR